MKSKKKIMIISLIIILTIVVIGVVIKQYLSSISLLNSNVESQQSSQTNTEDDLSLKLKNIENNTKELDKLLREKDVTD